MRSALSLAMCAYLAAAAAPALAAQSNYFIRLDGVDPGGRAADDHKNQIEILSWSWGETRAQGKVEHEWKVEEGESAPPQPGTAKYGAVSGMHRDESMAGGNSRARESGEKGGTEDINIGVGELQEGRGGDPDRPIVAGSVPNPSDAASGQATGKRQHKPIRTRAYDDAAAVGSAKKETVGGGRTSTSGKQNKMQELRARAVADIDKADIDKGVTSSGGTARFNPKEIAVTKTVPWQSVAQPLDRGAVRVKVKFPWVGCRVGARYPSLTLGGGAQRYELTDAVVTHCGSASSGGESLPMEEVSFNYGKVTVRGWDPAAKRE